MIANPVPGKKPIRQALEESIVTGLIALAGSIGGLLGTNVELGIRPLLIAAIAAFLAGTVTYARARQIEIKLGA